MTEPQSTQSKPSRVRRILKRIIFTWLVSFVLVFALWFGVYLWIGKQFDEILNHAITVAEYEGHAVNYQRFERGGFPHSVRRSYGQVQAEFVEFGTLLSPQITAEFFLIDPTRAEIRSPRLEFQGKAPRLGDTRHVLGATTLLLRRSFNGQAESVTLTSHDLQLSRTKGGPLSIDRLEAQVRAPNDAARAEKGHTLELSADFQGIHAEAFNQSGNPGFLTLEALLFGRLPSNASALELFAWRAGGGYLEITELRFSSGPAEFDIKGTLTIDNTNRPLGAGTLQFSSDTGLLGALGLDTRGAEKLKGLFNQLFPLFPPKEDEASPKPAIQFDLPWRIQDGDLFVGPKKVFTFTPLF